MLLIRHFQFSYLDLFFLNFSVKPEIQTVPDNGIIITETGKSVTLECAITRGFPTPEVSWHRRERKMPSGEESIRGLSITYTAVTRHHSGVYICDADNGFGDISSATLKLDVQRKFTNLFFRPCYLISNIICNISVY